ncbi:diguanylate cyclase (GGDEF)-like protein [Salirhabdus euzebyi]|uniref:Diguanylate cyclase (GGDEF)-like protein n=1 Tax=Salirhabdus euzebyi TaxID=394506 RepID=A0A841PTH8_9BACI|nr:sensor domain-containing diguanylate cyclase [Salirhabdus euzebyi]MBB6452129.1 diguanylate cyclase (GGDEF)-like protein [Salirhabdus euzebyi]
MTKKVLALDHLINDIKQKYYDLIMKQNHTTFPIFMSDLAGNIKDATKADFTELFLLNDSLRELVLLSNGELLKHTCKEHTVSLDEFECLLENSPKHCGFPVSNALLGDRADHLYCFIVPLKVEKEINGFILLGFDKATFNEEITAYFDEIAFQTLQIIIKMKHFYTSISEEKKYELLYRLTSKFHSSINMEELLEEIILTLKQLYPSFNYYLLLSQYDFQKSNLPIREIDYYNEEHHASAQSYLTGQCQMESLSETEKSLYAPLKGKQGIYGVLQVITSQSALFSEDDIEFITLIANTAGNALENARLYQQSKRLIDDLQLIIKSSQKLNSKMRLTDTFSYMSHLIQDSFRAEQVGFVLYPNNEVKNFNVLEESSSFFSTEEGLAFVSFIHNCIHNKTTTMFIGDFSNKYPNVSLPFQSVMAVPMVHEQNIIGFVVVLHKIEYFFSFETYKLLQALVHHSALTVVNSLLKEELEQLVRTDYLTKLYSRKHLDEMMNKHIEHGQQGSFILIDIDNFKSINDEYGHDMGDQIITQVAEIIRENIRSHDVAARWGGEELAIYLPNTSLTAGAQVAERLVETVAMKTNPKVTISCGIAFWNNKLVDNSREIFLRADRALYIAKEQGKNRVVNQNEIVV